MFNFKHLAACLNLDQACFSFFIDEILDEKTFILQQKSLRKIVAQMMRWFCGQKVEWK